MERRRAFRKDLDLSSDELDADAARVVEAMARNGYRPSAEVELIRKRYTASMARFTPQIEEVGRVTRVAPSAGLIAPLTVVRPICASPTPLSALVYLHGGGWTFGGVSLYESFLCRLANATGRVVVAVDYRLAPEHPFPAALEDTWNAVEWVAANAAWIGVDPDQIAIGGDDAGGNLASVTAIAARDGLVSVSLQFQLLIYPCLDLTASLPSHDVIPWSYPLTREIYAWCRANYVGTFPDLEDWHLSPLRADDLSAVAPAIMVYAGFDPLRDEAAIYCSRLRQAGVAVSPIFFPQLMHSFITMGGAVPAATQGVTMIAAVIREWSGQSPGGQWGGDAAPTTVLDSCL